MGARVLTETLAFTRKYLNLTSGDENDGVNVGNDTFQDILINQFNQTIA